MRADGLLALQTGVFRLPDGQPATFETFEFGKLRVSSGQLAISDPLLLQTPSVLSIPPGDYKVVATIAQVPESYDLALSRPAYLSLVLSDQPTVSVAPATFEPSHVEAGTRLVDQRAGMPNLRGIPSSEMSSVAMSDAEAIVPNMPSDPDTWFDTVISPSDGSGWFDRMDTEIDGPLGSLITTLPKAVDGENIAILIARPERVFPVVESRDETGKLTGIHIDLLVIGALSEALHAFDGQDELALEYAHEAERTANRQANSGARESRGVLGLLKKFLNL
ncbi:hypothetical protein [Glutamicibacter sp. AOP5-A2-18]|uniref:hypothetical protein n=1 Tax=Glutamicibacter sp. AOP5-A2-18 TaxID=3457656 RepID=UPI004033414B